MMILNELGKDISPVRLPSRPCIFAPVAFLSHIPLPTTTTTHYQPRHGMDTTRTSLAVWELDNHMDADAADCWMEIFLPWRTRMY